MENTESRQEPHKNQKPGGDKTKSEKSGAKARESAVPDERQKKTGFFSRRQKDKQPQDKQNPKVKQSPGETEPATFHEHVLDLNPDFVMPVRQSVDLDYVDFTRESMDERERRPFTPKKRNVVPYEMSDTPKTYTEPRNMRQNDRRKPPVSEALPAPGTGERQEGNRVEKATNPRIESGNQGKNKRDTRRQTQDSGDQGKQQKSHNDKPNVRQDIKGEDKASENRKPMQNQNNSRKQNQDQNRQIKRTNPASNTKGLRNEEAGKEQTDKGKTREPRQSGAEKSQEASQSGNGQESAKVSLIRPYWIKK